MNKDNQDGKTSRRIVLETLLCLGGGSALQASADSAAWQAFEAVEASWIRERHRLLLLHAPGVAQAAELELDLRLTDLERRRRQFTHLQRRKSQLIGGGIWQLTSFSLPQTEHTALLGSDPAYRMLDGKVRRLTETLRQHPGHDEFRAAQTHLWKTPLYREQHRRYLQRMQHLQKLYSGESLITESLRPGDR